jgi:hypothetical protein
MTSTNTLTILQAAYKLIRVKSRWCQGGYARNKKGEKVVETSPKASQWCAVGACWKCKKKDDLESLHRAVRALNEATNACSPTAVNDEHGHAAVLRMFRKAIAAEKGRL